MNNVAIDLPFGDPWEYEANHEIAFAAPSALAEARVIAKLEALKKERAARRKKSAPKSRR